MTESKKLAAIRQALEDYTEGEAIDPMLEQAGLAREPVVISHDKAVRLLKTLIE